jgi:hypothetical protein
MSVERLYGGRKPIREEADVTIRTSIEQAVPLIRGGDRFPSGVVDGPHGTLSFLVGTSSRGTVEAEHDARRRMNKPRARPQGRSLKWLRSIPRPGHRVGEGGWRREEESWARQ